MTSYVNTTPRETTHKVSKNVTSYQMTSLSASSETGLGKNNNLDQLKSDKVMNTLSNNLNEDL